jgi:catalase-peroxidase
LGKDAPKVTLTWQDPLPKANYAPVDAGDISQLKANILASGLTTAELVRTAWASASSFRATDMRGGANGARLRLAPQKDWAVNDPAEVAKVLVKLEIVRTAFNKSATGGKQVSLADLIVLGGNAAIEQAAKAAGQDIIVPFSAGRVDATQSQTDVESFNQLQPKADGFRNYFASDAFYGPTEALIDKADLLGLTVTETTVLVGGMRVLGANAGGSTAGVFTNKPGTLTNDFFTNLLSMDTVWAKSATNAGLYEGKDRATGAAKWTATPVDLVFGSNAELRAVAEVYASDDAKQKFVTDFVAAWTKVMNADRF